MRYYEKVNLKLNFFEKPDDELKSKIDEYSKYIKEHIENVKECWANHTDAIIKYLKDNEYRDSIVNMLIDRINRNIDYETHDFSKWSNEEFIAYRVKFYPTTKEQDIISRYSACQALVNDYFNRAWGHHVHNNPHHPEHWIIANEDGKPNTIISMDTEYIVEMLMDWEAMGRKFGGNAYSYWYDKAKKSKANLFNEVTVNTIEAILEYIK